MLLGVELKIKENSFSNQKVSGEKIELIERRLTRHI